MISRSTVIVLSLLCVTAACEEPTRSADVREGRGSTREAAPDEPPPADPGPQVWRPSGNGGGGSAVEAGGGGGGSSMDRRDRPNKRLTKAEVQARFASLRAIDDEAGACQQAFLALRETREGMSELLDEERMGGPNRADYVALCRAFPAEVQRCLTPSYQAANAEACRARLTRFGNNRDDPAWLERLTGDPPSERPAPATSEAEGRALNRRRRAAMN